MPIPQSHHKLYVRPQAADTVPTDRIAAAATLGTGTGTATKVDLGGGRYAWRITGQREAPITSFDLDTTQAATVYVMVATLRLHTAPTSGNQYLRAPQFAESSSSGIGLGLSMERISGAINLYAVQSSNGLLPNPLDIDDGVQRTFVVRVQGGALGARRIEWWLSSGSGSAADQSLTTGSFAGNVGGSAVDTFSINLPGEAAVEYENISLFVGPGADFDGATCRLLATDFDAAIGAGSALSGSAALAAHGAAGTLGVLPASVLSGAAALVAHGAAGTLSVPPPVGLSGNAELGAWLASGSIYSGVASITTGVVKSPVGLPLPGAAAAWVQFIRAQDGQSVLALANQVATSHPTAPVFEYLARGEFTAGQQYVVVSFGDSGEKLGAEICTAVPA